MRAVRFLTAFTLAVTVAGCKDGPTALPPIEPVTVPGTFEASITGAEEFELAGDASYAPFGPSTGLSATLDDAVTTHSIVFAPGVTVDGFPFAFQEGRFEFDEVPGFRTADGTFRLVGASTQEFFATSGYIKIDENGAAGIRATFDFRGTAPIANGTRRVRVRGSFWATPST